MNNLFLFGPDHMKVLMRGLATGGRPLEESSEKSLKLRIGGRGGFGLNEVIGIAAGIIIAVVVVIPGLRQFAASVLNQLTQWWNNMASGIFSS